jgi:hypothetical protein
MRNTHTHTHTHNISIFQLRKFRSIAGREAIDGRHSVRECHDIERERERDGKKFRILSMYSSLSLSLSLASKLFLRKVIWQQKKLCKKTFSLRYCLRSATIDGCDGCHWSTGCETLSSEVRHGPGAIGQRQHSEHCLSSPHNRSPTTLSLRNEIVHVHVHVQAVLQRARSSGTHLLRFTGVQKRFFFALL